MLEESIQVRHFRESRGDAEWTFSLRFPIRHRRMASQRTAIVFLLAERMRFYNKLVVQRCIGLKQYRQRFI